MILVLAGPSGVGKGSVYEGLRRRDPRYWRSVSWTTRPIRNGEAEGREYHFVTVDEFERERTGKGFLESFEVYGRMYGTPARPVDEHLADGDIVVLDIDVQGALRVRELIPEALLVFLAPPSPEELRARLLGRHDGMSVEALEARLAASSAELESADEFDAVVVNDDLDRAVEEVARLVERHLAVAESTPTEN